MPSRRRRAAAAVALVVLLLSAASAGVAWAVSYRIYAAYEFGHRPLPAEDGVVPASSRKLRLPGIGPAHAGTRWFLVQQPGRLSLVRHDLTGVGPAHSVAVHGPRSVAVAVVFHSIYRPPTKLRDPAEVPLNFIERLGFAAVSEGHGLQAYGDDRPFLRSRQWMLPHWLLVAVPLALAAVPGRTVWRGRRSRRWAAEGRCPRCGYDLRATPGRCPECGRSG